MAPDYSTPNRKKRYVEEVCRIIQDAAKKINMQKDTYVGGVYGIRRQKAILNYLDRAEKEFQTFGLTSIVESFVQHELLTGYNYNQIDSTCDLRIGAALWILEKLRAEGKLEQAYDVIPDVGDEVDTMYLPMEFSHPCYDYALIQSVIYVISNRYGRQKNAVITEENTVRKEPDETYRQLLDLLSAEDVERACREFRNKTWELETRFMKCQGYYEREIERIDRDIEKIQNARFPGPFANPMVGIGLPAKFTLPQDNNVDYMVRREEELIEQSKHLKKEFERYLWMDRKAIRRETGSREVAEALDGFFVKDPYELCFALFYLIDTGDDIVWLMQSGCSLMLYVLKMLPWYLDHEGWEDEDWDAWYDGIPYNRNGWLEQEKPEEQIDFYHERHCGQNLAQIIYGLCRTVVPTGLHPFEEDRKRLIKEGMDEDTARKITDIAELLFLYEFRASRSLENIFPWTDGEEDEEDKKEEKPEMNTSVPKSGGCRGKAAEQDIEGLSDNTAETEEDNVKLKEELKAAKKQLKSLKNALAVARQEAGHERAKYEHELKNLRMEHRELADLRELVFNSELSEEGRARREEPKKHYSYPYATRKRTVVFGGHDSFLRAFKPMLPDVKFVDPGNLTYNPEIIRNSDVVWIQNNCISHSQYWSIVKNCKQSGIQMRYFGFSSAEKCAEQLVTEDMK